MAVSPCVFCGLNVVVCGEEQAELVERPETTFSSLCWPFLPPFSDSRQSFIFFLSSPNCYTAQQLIVVPVHGAMSKEPSGKCKRLEKASYVSFCCCIFFVWPTWQSQVLGWTRAASKSGSCVRERIVSLSRAAWLQHKSYDTVILRKVCYWTPYVFGDLNGSNDP